ncbi:MAG: hypothetical protein M1819_004947 [Sarea resinae]|nr:MAG: hypothetical protein M1819_004947 [Sarea resinae]
MDALRVLYTYIRGALITAPWVLHLYGADLILITLFPLSFVLPNVAYNLSSAVASSVWWGIQTIFTDMNGANISFSGAPPPQGESAIVISNHVGWSDFYMVQALAIRADMLGRCRWFAKQQLKWVPFLGWGLKAMGMPMVSREWTRDRREFQRVFSGITENRWPIWLISFSEATRYTPEKYAQTVAWCKAKDKPVPKHTLYPRTKGFVTTVNQLRQAAHVRAVYDLTIAYAHHNDFLVAPSMWQTLSSPDLGSSWRFHVHVDRYPIEDLPIAEDELSQWIEARWIEKGERLEALRGHLARGRRWDDLDGTD